MGEEELVHLVNMLLVFVLQQEKKIVSGDVYFN